jgi:hypothetical protein
MSLMASDPSTIADGTDRRLVLGRRKQAVAAKLRPSREWGGTEHTPYFKVLLINRRLTHLSVLPAAAVG